MDTLFFLSLLFFFLFILFPLSSTQGPTDIFLLAGQSNMGGRGGVVAGVWDKFVPPESQPNPIILRLNQFLEWEEAVEPIHRDIDVSEWAVPGIGPGMPFSTTLLKRDPSFNNGVIGLVPAAMGGTNISAWQRGSFLYGRLLTRAQAAVHEGGVIRGMLWYQGESDITLFENAIMYKARVQQFFSYIRSDLILPSLPIIQVALASCNCPKLNETNAEIVRQAQLGLAMPFVKCVDAKGLQLEPDNLHLTTGSQVRLGEMFTDAFLGPW